MPPPPWSVYHDDLLVADNVELLRLVKADKVKWSREDPLVAERAGSNAFEDYPADRLHEVEAPAVAVSVFRRDCLRARGIDWPDLIDRWGDDYGIAVIGAGAVRLAGQGVIKWPNSQDESHCMIYTREGTQKSPKDSKRLAKLTKMLASPPRR